MNAWAVIDIYATKGIEYLVVIAYLSTLAYFWLLLSRAGQAREAARKEAVVPQWFTVPKGVFLHSGHSWVRPNGGPVHVGLDDFASKLIGPPDRIDLPAVGDRVQAGAVSYQLERGGKRLSVLSPVSGEVVAVNEDAISNPARNWSDPYQTNWLMKVRPDHLKRSLSELASGKRAKLWMDDVTSQLMERMPSPVGAVMQDGGIPVEGIAQEIDPEGWNELVEEFLGTKSE